VIVRRLEGELWLFDQADHAALCGVMADAWGSAGFEPVPPPVREAAGIHDLGWPEWDVRPRLHPERGEPHPYSDMPSEDYLEIWRRGLARGWSRGDAAGLMVSLHALRFFTRKKRPQDRALCEIERLRQRAALQRLGAVPADPEELPEPFATWHEWFFFWDGLSLFLCEGWDSPWKRTLPRGSESVDVGVSRMEEGSGGAVVVEPYPFTTDLSLEADARVIPADRYTTQGELDDALAGADRRTLRWILRET
jgi:hypothetical protein